MCWPRATSYSVVGDFGIEHGNPSGAWSYGWMPAELGAFVPFAHSGPGYGGSPEWNRDPNDQPPIVWKNTTETTAYGVAPGAVALHPGPGHEAAVVRWTAPGNEVVRVEGRFLPGDGAPMEVAVRFDGEPWWRAIDAGSFDLRTNVLAGDTIDFAVYGGYAFGNTPLEAIVTLGTGPVTGPCLPSPAGLETWWSGDGHAGDLVSGLVGRLEGASYADGIAGQAFRFEGNRGRVDFDRDAPSGAFTIEAWVRYDGDAWGKLGNGWSIILEFGNDQPTFGVRDTGELNFSPTLQGGYVPVKRWTHVAYTWDLVTSRLFINGSQVASTNLAPLTGGRGASLGWRTGDAPWLGLIDEVGIYGRALTSNEVATIHAVGSEGRCKDGVSGLREAPLILRQPVDQVAVTDVRFSVEVLGRPPLSFQWYHEGIPLKDATNAILNLPFTNVTAASAGGYWATVTNTFGSAQSTPAALQVPADLAILAISSPESVIAGDPVALSWAVTNRGPGIVTGSWRLRISLSPDASGIGATPLRTSVHTDALKPGEARTGETVVVFPAVAAGTGWLVVQVDPDNDLIEPDESNNARISASATAIRATDLAPLFLESPPRALPGQALALTWGVTNRSPIPALPPWTETLWVSNHAGTVRSLGVWHMTNALAPASGAVRSAAIRMPIDGDAGEGTFWIEIDSRREVVEADEDNNRLPAIRPTSLPLGLTLQWPFERIAENAPGPLPRGRVVRNGDPTGPLTVTLSSANPAEIRLPATAVIGPGESFAEFEIEVRRDGRVDGTQSVAIEASAGGFEPASVRVDVFDADVSQLAIRFGAAGIVEGGSLAGTVEFELPASIPRVVFLGSSDPGRFRVPASVTVDAGALSAVFHGEAPENRRIEATLSASVTARSPGASEASASVLVQDNDLPAVTLTLMDRVVSEGAGAAATTATVTRDPAGPYPLPLELFSTNTTAARIPPRVIIPAGQATVTFPVVAVDDGEVDGTQWTRLGGYLIEEESGNRLGDIEGEVLQVTDDDQPALRVNLVPELAGEGIPSASTATILRNPAAGTALTVQLGSSDPSEATVPATVIIPAGSDRVDVPIGTIADGVSDGNQRVTISARAAGFIEGNAILTVTDLELPDLAVTAVEAPPIAETESYVTVAYRVANQGLAAAPSNVLTRIYVSADPLFGGDTLVGQYRLAGSLPQGRHFEQSIQWRTPTAAGDYWIFVMTDAEGVVGESLEGNNVGSRATPVHVVAAYGAWVQAGLDRGLAGTAVPLNGRATNRLGASVPFQPVHIHVRVRQTERILAAITDTHGEFAAVFQPLPGEAGAYEVLATHPGIADTEVQDRFELFGAVAEPSALSIRWAEGATAAGTLAIVNTGDSPLSALQASLDTLPAGVNGKLNLSSNVVPARGRTELAYSFEAARGASGGAGRIRVTTAEGAVVEVPVELAVILPRPQWAAYPGELVAGMVRGGQTLLDVDIVNRGAAVSPPSVLSFPPVPWLSVLQGQVMPALAPGETNRVTIRLAPAADLPVGDYAGAIVLAADELSTALPFRFRCLSEARGDLRIEAEDEFTYFAEGAPRVGGATVTVRDAVSQVVVREGATDVDGRYAAFGLPEGYYQIEVTSPDHDGVDVTRLLLAGQTNTVTAFLRRQTVRYHWSVVPTEVEDRTRIVIETVFEASVPAPVVTVAPASIDVGAFVADVNQVDLVVTNHGLIAADDIRLTFPTDPDWRFTPLIENLGTLPARGSLTIPLVIERVRAARPSSGSFGEPATGDCVKAGTACGQYWCGRVIRFCQPIVLQRLRGDCGSPGAMIFPELKFRGDWSPSQSGTVNPGGRGGGGWFIPPFHVLSPSTCQECIKVFESVLTECSPEQIAQHEAGWYLVYNLACRGEAPQGFSVDDVMPAVFSQMQANCPDDDTLWRPPDPKCYTLALVCPGWARAGALSAVGSKLVDQIPQALARQVPLAVTLAERLDRLDAGLGVLRTIFGDETWLTAAGEAFFPQWVNRFTASLSPGSDAGARISPMEEQSLQEIPQGSVLSSNHVPRLVSRCNRTVDYNAAGIFDVTQVPAGQSIDFIARNDFRDAVVSAGQAAALSRAEGFGNMVDAANAAYAELMTHLRAPGGGGGVCAQVRLRLEQEAVLTRDAFRATLELENQLGLALRDISVELVVLDERGAEVSDRFGVRGPDLEAWSAVDGTGTIDPHRTGRATWTLIPGQEAAGDGPVAYAVGGTLRYTQEGLRVTVPLSAVVIRVHPNPRLFVKYFHQRDVFSDDPYTDVVEPAIPYSLAVLVENRGRGDARNVRITSGQPSLIDNEKGLLIDFQILATEVAGRSLNPSLTVDFGAITNGQSAVGRWLLTSTLQGLFTEYTATFEHLDGLGNTRLSVIEDVSIHELIHLVQAGGAFEDGKPDFLVNEIPDAGDLPDTLYLSDGRTNRVSAVESGSVDAPPTATRRSVLLTAPMPHGWGYLRMPEPSAGRLTLRRIIRADGTEVAFGTNAWTTDRTFPGLGRRPIREHRLHLLDYNSSGRYTLEYEETEPRDTRAPESHVATLPADSPPQFRVSWAGDDEGGGSGLASFDVLVSEDGAPFHPWLERTPLRSALFSGRQGSRYAFYSVAMDRAGNRESVPTVPDTETRASVVNRPPEYAGPFEWIVDEGQRVDVWLRATDPDVVDGDGGLNYRLGSGAPLGATIDGESGRFQWVTGEASGPGTNRFEVIATDRGLPPLGTTGQVQIIIREINTAPVLEPYEPLVIAEGATLVVTNRATDIDLPANALTYSLGPGVPPGLTLDAGTGILRWTPTALQGPSTHRFEIRVTDNGSPPLTDGRLFEVRVRDTRPAYVVNLGSTNLLDSESSSIPILLDTTLELARMGFVLDVAAARLDPMALETPSAELLSSTLQPVTPTRSRIEFEWKPGASRFGPRELARLRFTALPGQPSAVVVLAAHEMEAETRDGGPLLRGADAFGRVVIVGTGPVLTIERDPTPAVRLYGRAGRRYRIEVRELAGGTNPWTLWQSAVLGGRFTDFPLEVLEGASRYYRAQEASGVLLRIQRRDGATYAFEAAVAPGQRYDVQSRTALMPGAPWQRLFELMPTNAAIRNFEWTDPGESLRFFRLRGSMGSVLYY